MKFDFVLTLYRRLSWPLNHWLGRRWTIFLAALCSAGFCLGQALARDWRTMFALRFLLGFGIGPKSATIPIYAAECAPADIRGALVMMWQLSTAGGIMLGYLSGVLFANVSGGAILLEAPNAPDTSSLAWRLMIGSPMVAPAFLALYIFVQPESPRWLIYKAQRARRRAQRHRGRDQDQDRKACKLYAHVFASLVRLRGGSKVKAARDMLTIDLLLWRQAEQMNRSATNSDADSGDSTTALIREAGRCIKELFTNQRNLCALRASSILMLLQQFCGINVRTPNPSAQTVSSLKSILTAPRS